MNSESVRLPCRGCLLNCKNYSVCQGRPWRPVREQGVSENIKKQKPKAAAVVL